MSAAATLARPRPAAKQRLDGRPRVTATVAARRFVFNAATPWIYVCWNPESNRLGPVRRADYFGMHRIAEPEEAVAFALPYGEWIRLFGRNGSRSRTW